MCSNNVGGSISPQVGAFVNLTYFDVSINYMVGPVPANVSRWSQIKYFDVSHNQFSGALPEMPFGQMNTCGLLWGDSKFDAPNRFDCPWPAGATADCGVTNDDCHTPTPAPTTAPSPSPTPPPTPPGGGATVPAATIAGVTAAFLAFGACCEWRVRRARTATADTTKATDSAYATMGEGGAVKCTSCGEVLPPHAANPFCTFCGHQQ
jgi:hypothetical protein